MRAVANLNPIRVATGYERYKINIYDKINSTLQNCTKLKFSDIIGT